MIHLSSQAFTSIINWTSPNHKTDPATLHTHISFPPDCLCHSSRIKTLQPKHVTLTHTVQFLCISSCFTRAERRGFLFRNCHLFNLIKRVLPCCSISSAAQPASVSPPQKAGILLRAEISRISSKSLSRRHFFFFFALHFLTQ